MCRDPIIQQAYAVDPLCVPTGTFKGVSDMLLGVRFRSLTEVEVLMLEDRARRS